MIHLANVHKSFGDVVAVRDLSLEIHDGEVFGLLGPNGAGKTTTVNMMIGLLAPDRGTVQIDGAGDPTGARIRRRLGVAPQALAIYDQMSGRGNLAFFGRLYGISGRKLAERVDWTLEFVGLTDRRNDLVGTYSGGMKRRLNLAAALVHDPPVLLLDEPTVGVDPQSRNKIFESILTLNRQGRTILYTTHYMEEAQRLCDRVAILEEGRLLALDTVRALLEEHGGKTTITLLREDGEQKIQTDDPVAELRRLQEAPDVLNFTVEAPDLESVFLNLTGRHLRD